MIANYNETVTLDPSHSLWYDFDGWNEHSSMNEYYCIHSNQLTICC